MTLKLLSPDVLRKLIFLPKSTVSIIFLSSITWLAVQHLETCAFSSMKNWSLKDSHGNIFNKKYTHCNYLESWILTFLRVQIRALISIHPHSTIDLKHIIFKLFLSILQQKLNELKEKKSPYRAWLRLNAP